MILIIDDDALMAKCIARACKGHDVKIVNNAFEAIKMIDERMPNLIFLDILLDGPDGFTLINELASYTDTARIPIVVVSSLNLMDKDLVSYNVAGLLSKDSMMPEEIMTYAREYDDERH